MTRESRAGANRAAKKSLGQNFLVNDGVIKKIVYCLSVPPESCVVEIGPGRGALTGLLCQQVRKIIAVEIDDFLAKELPSKVAFPGRLVVSTEDARFFNFRSVAEKEHESLFVVGNLPFNVGNMILRNALEQGDAIRKMVFMFQTEVAQRLISKVGTSNYSLHTVAVLQRATVRKLFSVSPGSFRPVPKVSATVLEFIPNPAPMCSCCLKVHDEFLRCVFSARRKTLRRSLQSSLWNMDSLESAFESAGISMKERPQAVSVEQYRIIAESLCSEHKKHPTNCGTGIPM